MWQEPGPKLSKVDFFGLFRSAERGALPYWPRFWDDRVIAHSPSRALP